MAAEREEMMNQTAKMLPDDRSAGIRLCTVAIFRQPQLNNVLLESY